MKNGKATLMQRRARFGYFFIFPLLLGVVFIFIPNLIQTFRYSVSNVDASAGFRLNYQGFDYYVEALTKDANFIPKLLENLQGLAVRVPVILIYSLFIATLLNQRFHGRVLARLIFFVPVILATGVISEVDSSAMWYAGAGQAIDTGATSNMSSLTDMSQFLYSINLPSFLISVVTYAIDNIYLVTSMSGLQIFIFLAGLQEIPTALYEAASIEGCSKWELFWKITFPMLGPQISLNMVYTIAEACTRGNNVMTYTNMLAFNQNRYALATSMNILYLLSLGAFIAFVLLLMRRAIPKT